jgi:hypothetical protein
LPCFSSNFTCCFLAAAYRFTFLMNSLPFKRKLSFRHYN